MGPLQKSKLNTQVPQVTHNQSTVESSDSSLISGDQTQSENKEQLEYILDLVPTETIEQIREKCRDRIQEYKKNVRKNMPFNDAMSMSGIDKNKPEEIQMVAEYAQEIYQSMLDKEKDYIIDHDYLKKVQTEVKDTSRGFLVEWIIDVHRKFRLMPETLYQTISILDRYLSKVNIKKSQLHLLGLTALLISTKYEEIYPPELQDLLGISENKFTKVEVLEMET